MNDVAVTYDSRLRIWLFLGLTLLASLVLLMLNVILGSVDIPLDQVGRIIIDGESDRKAWTNIVMKSRLPQAITAMLAGAGLSVGGLQMQTLFRNPLAGPSVLGISSGASLGVAFVLLLSGKLIGVALSQFGFMGDVAVTIAAFVGAMSVLFIVVFFSERVKGNATLLIIGIMVGYAGAAIVGMLKFFSLEEDIRAYVIWGLGSFAKVSTSQMKIFAPVMIVALIGSMLLAKSLNLLQLGDNYARNLGLNIKRIRILVILSAGFLTATVTAFCGPVIFLGLAVPHLTRGILKTSDHRKLLPGVVMMGILLALLCALIARLPGFDGALPVNSITSLVGAPVVVMVLMQKRKTIEE
ncbi:iron ABC transporter permease [Puteibacter caeruleilacunae]|nr:iron ABC transporter permease [Puteibacter caeruleilacunae]